MLRSVPRDKKSQTTFNYSIFNIWTVLCFCLSCVMRLSFLCSGLRRYDVLINVLIQIMFKHWKISCSKQRWSTRLMRSCMLSYIYIYIWLWSVVLVWNQTELNSSLLNFFTNISTKMLKPKDVTHESVLIKLMTPLFMTDGSQLSII